MIFQNMIGQTFIKTDMKTFLKNAPSPRGMPVQINCFIDANHAGNKLNQRSCTSILIYLNEAPIITFGSEYSLKDSNRNYKRVKV